MAPHRLPDVTVVADAGMISEANQKAIEAEGLSFILGMKVPDVPCLVDQWRREHPGEEIPTGITNATESLNLLAKLEARLADGFRSPLNQRRRVRIACTRGIPPSVTHRDPEASAFGNWTATRSRLL
jgi:hypothetical protein